MSKIAVVTGGTSGIGRETALYLANHDCTVYELSRRAEGVAGLRHISADVTDELSVQAAVSQILAEAGRIDILVNSAGFGISGAVEFTDTEEAIRQMNVNFFGMVRMNRAVIAAMRQQGGGRIVNLSSVAAPVPIPFQTYYSASKAAINSYTMALGNELRPFGITVCAVQPGDIKTGFTAARSKVTQGDDVYGGRISRSVERMERDEQNGMDPAKAGTFVAKVALKTGHKPLYTIGFSYKAAVLLTKILPARALNRLIGKIYAN
ncbi:MAG: SDR family oxidoreductase [Clostridiales bacterium]|nr:SDR family oxidoreductase [Clostridiales bacterium]